MAELFKGITMTFPLVLFPVAILGGSNTEPALSAAYIQKDCHPELILVPVHSGALIAGDKVSLIPGKGLLIKYFFTTLNR